MRRMPEPLRGHGRNGYTVLPEKQNQPWRVGDVWWASTKKVCRVQSSQNTFNRDFPPPGGSRFNSSLQYIGKERVYFPLWWDKPVHGCSNPAEIQPMRQLPSLYCGFYPLNEVVVRFTMIQASSQRAQFYIGAIPSFCQHTIQVIQAIQVTSWL